MTKDELKETIAALRKTFGKEILRDLVYTQTGVPAIPTGSLSVDKATGIGGIPRGRITEIFGPEGGGKTTMAQHIIAEAQAIGLRTAYIDMEHKFNQNYAARCGVDIGPDFLFSQPTNGIAALKVAQALISSGKVGLIVIDSVDGLTTTAEMDAEPGDQFPGVRARLVGQAIRRMNPILGENDTTLLFINQLRMRIGVMFGNPETTSAGKSLRYYSSLRLRVSRTVNIPTKNPWGQGVRVMVHKNNCAPPWREASFIIRFDEGIEKGDDLLTTASKVGVVEQSGANYVYQGERIAYGKSAAAAALEGNPELFGKIRQEVLDEIRKPNAATTSNGVCIEADNGSEDGVDSPSDS